jgi:two-component system cell cycle sensor histidine kinase/response regulator CckA
VGLREVSTNGVRILLNALESTGIAAQSLLDGMPITVAELGLPGERVDWDVWVELTLRLEAWLGSEQALEDFFCQAATVASPFHQFQRVAQLVSSPPMLYRLNSEWGIPNQFRNMRSSCEAVAFDQLRISLTVLEGYRCPSSVFRASVGVLRGIPKLIGLAEAKIISVEFWERRAQVVLEPPPSQTLVSRIRRAGRKLRGLESMLLQLSEQELELDEKRVTLEQQLEEQRRIDAALERSEARWRALAENAPGIILLLSREGRIVSASRSFRGLEPSALVERRLADLVLPKHRAELEAALAALTDERRISDLEFQTIAEDGNETYYACRLGGLSAGKDGLEICAFLSDISGRRRAEQALEEREEELERNQRLEALGRLAGGVAHDFNNLLTVICAGTELLLNERWPAAEQREELTQIQLAGERAATLTRQLLAFSRQQLIAPETLDLREVVQGARGMLERLMGEDIRVELHAPDGPYLAKLDRGQIEQILMNLAANARDAMPRGGTLKLGLRWLEHETAARLGSSDVEAGRYVELGVEDSGLGVEPETLRHIFEPFFSTKTRGRGTGLGLAIVRGIVLQSRGHVAVESQLGRGTTFRLLFPFCDDAATKPAPIALSPARGGVERILLVEDDALVRSLVQRVLGSRGYRVTATEGSAEALEHAEREAWDLLLTDVVMPDISGPELARLLTRRQPALRVLLMSGYAKDEIIDRGVVSAGVALLPKPFTPERLLAAVRKSLDERGQSAESG